jgi:hypothetical protein
MKAIGYNNLPIEDIKSLEDIVLEATKSNRERYLSGDKSHISKPSRL